MGHSYGDHMTVDLLRHLQHYESKLLQQLAILNRSTSSWSGALDTVEHCTVHAVDVKPIHRAVEVAARVSNEHAEITRRLADTADDLPHKGMLFEIHVEYEALAEGVSTQLGAVKTQIRMLKNSERNND